MTPQRTTVGAVLRSNQAFYQQICQRETLKYGVAFFSEAYAALPQAGQFREVVIDAADAIPLAFEEAETFFDNKGLTCRRWAPAEGAAFAGLAEFLAGRGFAERVSDVMVLAARPAIDRPAGVRVLPARALRAAFQATFQAAGGADAALAGLNAAAYAERLDDAHMDMYVALVDGRPAGRCGLYQVGDIGRMKGLCVMPGFEERGVERALLEQTLALAQRLALPMVCAAVHRADDRRRRWYEQAGFQVDGQVVEYERT